MIPGALRLDRAVRSTGVDLVDRAADGDGTAFDEIARRVGDGLYLRALAILGNEPDARDATQEALIRGWRELPRLGSADRFDAWLDRILVNVCRDQLRRRGRRQLREISPLVDAASNDWIGVAASDPRSDETFRSAVGAAFRRLSIEDRTLLVLHHLEMRQVADIAAVLAIPPGTVMRRLHTARQRLQGALELESR